MTHRAAEASPDDGLLAPLRVRDFRGVWAGFVLSHVGDFVQLIAQNWLVTELTRSAFRVALVALAQALPRLLISLFAGVVVDRVDRRRLLLVTQSLAALQSLAFLALVRAHRVGYGTLLALALALGVLDSLNLTARQALVASLVPRAMLPRAVALQALGVNITQIAGPLTAAALLATLGVEGCLAANVVSFAAPLVALARMAPTPPLPPSGESFAQDLRAGLAYVTSRVELLVPIALAWALGLLCMPLVRLLQLVARTTLGCDARGYGVLYASSGVGALAASLLVTARSGRGDLPRNVAVAGGVWCVALAAFAWQRAVPGAALCLLAFGAAQMAFRSAAVTLLQSEVPDRLRGRVMSALSIDFSLWSLGGAASGWLADALATWRAGGALPTARDVSLGLSLALTAQAAVGLALVLATAKPFLGAARAALSSPDGAPR